jgi:glycosyltransferase A (GT-A) superfamily protein (DUF2064 family)
MKELFPAVPVEQKKKIKQTVEMLFDLYWNKTVLPTKLNDFVNSFSNLDEQEFADFCVTMKFMELNNEDNSD